VIRAERLSLADNPRTVLAAIIDAPGAEPRLGPIALPPRTPGTTLVAVVAAPLNPLDLLIASGTFHSARHEDPYVPGSECAGVVLDSDVYPPGSLVYAECHASPATPGALAAQALIVDEDLLPLPDGVDPVLAAAVGNSGTAAFMPLAEEAGLRPGETVLVLGAWRAQAFSPHAKCVITPDSTTHWRPTRDDWSTRP